MYYIRVKRTFSFVSFFVPFFLVSFFLSAKILRLVRERERACFLSMAEQDQFAWLGESFDMEDDPFAVISSEPSGASAPPFTDAQEPPAFDAQQLSSWDNNGGTVFGEEAPFSSLGFPSDS